MSDPSQIVYSDPCMLGINGEMPTHVLTILNTTLADNNAKAAICLQSDGNDANTPPANNGVLYVKNNILYFKTSSARYTVALVLAP